MGEEVPMTVGGEMLPELLLATEDPVIVDSLVNTCVFVVVAGIGGGTGISTDVLLGSVVMGSLL